MKILFFDATQDWIHVSTFLILEKQPLQLVYEYISYCPKESSYRLVTEIQKALINSGWEKPDILVCLKGPGSFTGIRITVSTGRNLSQLWKIPVIGVDSLLAYSTHFLTDHDHSVMIALDGRQNKRYFGILNRLEYRGSFDWNELEILEEMRKGEASGRKLVYSCSLPTSFTLDAIKIEETLPKSMSLLIEIKDILLQLNYTNSNYEHLLPNYVRGTYLETNKK